MGHLVFHSQRVYTTVEHTIMMACGLINQIYTLKISK